MLCSSQLWTSCLTSLCSLLDVRKICLWWVNPFNYEWIFCAWSKRLRRWTNMAITKGQGRTDQWSWLKIGPFIVWSHHNRLTVAFSWAIFRASLRPLAISGDMGSLIGSHPGYWHCSRQHGKGAKGAVTELKKLKRLRKEMIPTHMHTDKKARQVHKIIIILQLPLTWLPSYLLGTARRGKRLCQKAAFSLTFLAFHSLF